MSDNPAGLAARKLHDALQAMQRAGDPLARASARASAMVALEGFTAGNDRTGAAAAHQVLAMIAVMAGEWEEALASVDAAIPLRQSTGDREGVASLWQERMEIALRMGDGAASIAAARQQVAVLADAPDKEARAHASHQLAQLLLQAGQDAEAESQLQDALWTVEGPGYARARSALLLQLASVWIHRGEPARARSWAEQALELARQAKNRAAEIDALQHLGVILLAEGEPARARRVLEEALVGRELLRDLEGRALVLRELANADLALGDVDEALGRLEYAARTAAEAGNVGGAVAAHQLRIAAADAHDRLARGTESARALVSLATAAGDPAAAAAAHFMLGTRLAAEADLAGAAGAFRAARDAQAGLGLAHDAAVSAGMLGQVLLVGGAPDEGRTLLREAHATLRDLGSEAADTLLEILNELEGIPSHGDT
jgi:tetratricopeptide (TPR) repeat protein